MPEDTCEEEPAEGADAWHALREGAVAAGASLSAGQEAALRQYLELLCEWNSRFNLTAIRDPAEIVIKHFLDSLTCARAVDLACARTLIDVGCGAGFPGLPLKIAFPHLRVTLLDALQKRIGFLARVVEELGLEEVALVHGRAEDALLPQRCRVCGLDEPLRERFDVVTARAVASMDVLAEWTLPFARVGGVVLAMKGPDVAEEVAAARPALALLGGGEPVVTALTLPAVGGMTAVSRSLVCIPKVSRTPPQYPRLPGSARKHPLGGAAPVRRN